MRSITGADLVNLLETAEIEHGDEEAQAQLRRWRAQAQLVNTLHDLQICKQKGAGTAKAVDLNMLRELAKVYLASIPDDCSREWQEWCDTARIWPEKLEKSERDDKKVQIQKKKDQDVRILYEIWGPRAAVLLMRFQTYGSSYYSHPVTRYKALMAVLGSAACNAASEHGGNAEDTQHASSETRTPQLSSGSANATHALDGHDDARLTKRQRRDECLSPPHSNSLQNTYNAPPPHGQATKVGEPTVNITFVSRKPRSVLETYHLSTCSAVQLLMGICPTTTKPTSCDESHDYYRIFQDPVLASHLPCYPLIEAIQQSKRQQQQAGPLPEDYPGDDGKIKSITVKLPVGEWQRNSVVLVTID